MSGDLRSGERQVSPTLAGIRRDHVARYEWARERMNELAIRREVVRPDDPDPNPSVLDLMCGVGYGSAILASAGFRTIGIDRSRESIEYAREHYNGPEYIEADALVLGEYPSADVGVIFEGIEHLPEPALALRKMRRAVDRLFVSVPNELVFPFRGYAFHEKHYTPAELEALLNGSGWQVVSWHGQTGPLSEVEPRRNGRTIIAECVPSAAPESETWREGLDAAVKVPTRVAIVAMGRSCGEYIRQGAAQGGYPSFVDEVWAINAMGGVILHDKLFAMDDVRIQARRVAAMDAGEYKMNPPVYGTMQWLKHHSGPIYTSRAHPDYPGLVEIPAEEIMRACDAVYFNSTVAWALGFALLELKRHGALRDLYLFGVDFSYSDGHKAERGRGNTEFLIGKLVERGVRVHLPPTTTLLDACEPLHMKVYGYDTETIELEPSPDGPVFRRTPLPEEDWPNPLDIELRYRPGSNIQYTDEERAAEKPPTELVEDGDANT